MTLRWIPQWYELDWTIVVGDTDWFILSDEMFNNGIVHDEESITATKLKIQSITHPVLGDIKGIIAIGLDYTIYLANGELLTVNAEEEPGKIYESEYKVDNWTFEVSVQVLDDKGRLPCYEHDYERVIANERRIDRYKALLGITTAPWGGN
jgi:hypothetical protein